VIKSIQNSRLIQNMSQGMKKTLISSIVSLLLSPVFPVVAAPEQPKSFLQWCQQKGSVPATTRRTIDILLNEAGTKNCNLADRQLRTLTELDLSINQLVDIQPLAGLTNLKELRLDSNQIVDINPLAGLTNLTILYLHTNQIVDLKPLAGLTNLTALYLYSNQIVDVQPLSGLTNLTMLGLRSNQIVDVQSLAGLTNLTLLHISNNPIPIKVCPVKPASICR
jgi:internalin A